MHLQIIGAISAFSTGRSSAQAAHMHGKENWFNHTQNPSSARPTQLKAKIEQATAATDAQVAIVLAERMTKPFVESRQILSDHLCPMMAGIRQDK
jgi:hypothetical protein